jgi:hypothetical protein
VGADLAFGEGGERGFRLRRPAERVGAGGVQRAVAVQEREGMVEIALLLPALLDGAGPEGALLGVGGGDGLDERQRQLALAEVVARVFARGGGVAGIVEQVVDDLEADAERVAIAAQGGADRVGLAGDDAADLAGCRCRRRSTKLVYGPDSTAFTSPLPNS